MKLVSVSIVMTFYNRYNYIEDAIVSVLKQSIDNWELIIVDDGSSVDIAPLLIDFTQDRRISLVKKCNGGVSSARNYGAQLAKGPLLAFFDDDDIWYPSKLEEIVGASKKCPDIALFVSDAMMIDEQGVVIDGFQKKKNAVYATSWFDSPGGLNVIPPEMDLSIAYSGFALPSALVVKSDIFNKIGGFDENIKGCEDMDLVFRLSREYSVGYIDKKLIGYRITSNGLSRKNKIYSFQHSIKLYEKTIKIDLSKKDRVFLVKSQVAVRANLAYCYYKNDEYKLCRKWAFRAFQLGWHKTAAIYGFICLFPASLIKSVKKYRLKK